ncbi:MULTISPECIES: hypothetical protein [unclassified Streptomyces]|uniref:hypothetical protein n=1 Tax=unclassified Streptomyces TaxID=2593676 RepID=UPI001CBC2E08|nr:MULTISPECIES: hypothetical protein [unclassified Streptomyces]WPO73236.1 hypothetical protein R9806_22700 [Streptomyces sp. KN37]
MGIKDQFQDKAQDLAEKAKSRTGDKDKMRERGSQAQDDLRERGTRARDEASERSSQARDTARRQRDMDEDYEI